MKGFSDAFKHLTVRGNEYRYLSGSFGRLLRLRNSVVRGQDRPISLGKDIAALIARSTQHSSRCRLQIFVDDPLIVARGTEAQLNTIFNIVSLCCCAQWLALGLKVAWSKGALGPEAEWIGAKLVINDCKGYVRVMVTASKLEEWRVLP